MRNRELNEYFNMTQQEIGEAMDLTRENTSAIEKSALKKLRKLLEEKGYKASDFIGGMA